MTIIFFVIHLTQGRFPLCKGLAAIKKRCQEGSKRFYSYFYQLIFEVKMATLHFTILGIPCAKQSARFTSVGGRVRSYQKKEIVQQEQNLAWQIRQQLPEGFFPTEKPVTVKSLQFIFTPPKSINKRLLADIMLGIIVPKHTKPDLQDNLCKMLFDAMQGIVYLNDSQIWQIKHSAKFYGARPCINVEIEF